MEVAHPAELSLAAPGGTCGWAGSGLSPLPAGPARIQTLVPQRSDQGCRIFFPWWGKAQRKTRAPGSHRPEQRQRQALPRDDAPVAAATSPPAVTHGDAVALAFPGKSNLGKQQQQEEADLPHVPGISSQPCARWGFFLATTLSRSREQPVSRLRAATETAGEWGALPAPPEHLHAATPHPRVPTQHLLGLEQQCSWFHPPNCSRMLSVMRWAAGGCLSPLPKPRQTPKHLPVGKEGPSHLLPGSRGQGQECLWEAGSPS